MTISVPGRSGREGRLIRCLRQARRDGRLPERFRAADARKACPEAAESTFGTFLAKHQVSMSRSMAFQSAESTFGTFLAKHRAGDPGGNSELFVCHAPGLYSLIDE